MIKDITLIPFWNSIGERTVKASVHTERGIFSSLAPAGKLKGKWEAPTVDIKDAIINFKEFRGDFARLNEEDFDIIDDKLEGIGFKKIGATLSTAVSQACIRAASNGNVYRHLNPEAKIFPFPLGNVMGGGTYGGFCSIQEFLVIPANARNILEAIKTNFNIWKDIGNILRERKMNFGKNDEGAWSSPLTDLKTIDIVSHVAERYDAVIGLDMAASRFYKKGVYVYDKIGKKFDVGEQLDFVRQLIKTYRIKYVEDPFQENDFRAFSELSKRVKGVIICGDDLYASQPIRLKRGIGEKSGNAVLVKVDQAGTVSKALRTIDTAKDSKIVHIISHRSGETNDNFISDLAVATEAPLIKCGISGGERVSKLNRLLEMWLEISNTKKPEMANLKYM